MKKAGRVDVAIYGECARLEVIRRDEAAHLACDELRRVLTPGDPHAESRADARAEAGRGVVGDGVEHGRELLERG